MPIPSSYPCDEDPKCEAYYTLAAARDSQGVVLSFKLAVGDRGLGWNEQPLVLLLCKPWRNIELALTRAGSRPHHPSLFFSQLDCH